MKRVVVVIFDQAQLLDLAGPLDAIAAANQALMLEGRSEAYRIEVASLSGGTVVTGVGLGVASERLTEVALGAAVAPADYLERFAADAPGLAA